MRGVSFGTLYNKYGMNEYDPVIIEQKVRQLMEDEDVTKKPGIYTYIFTGNEKYLNIRGFENRQKRETYEKQNGICPKCNERFEFEEMEADHINPWSRGGKTILENCQMLCQQCNRTKSNV
jgi:5-methylcytosine-specific restriction endonuclease McrA